MIVAKTVVPNQYWILQQDDQKIGNIEAGPDGYAVKIKDSIQKFKTIRMVKNRIGVEFQPIVTCKPRLDTSCQVHGYPTTTRPYNGIYDVRHQVPLWTREPRSKSWYAAGWYLVKQGRAWSAVQCPKLITLNRYQYRGPFHTREEAENQ
jgi:hypothetical protein